jgi:methylmalonyl-CoA/ethylmalonyl-CoA epimerase
MMTAQETLEITGIGQIAVNVQDLARATAFYRDTLGMRLLYEFPGLAFFDCGGVRLMLSRAEKPEFDHLTSTIYYRVADIQQSWRMMTDAGVKIEHEPELIARMSDHDLWMCFIRDTENNILGLMAEVRNS